MRTPGPPLRRTYTFNGVETRETFPMPDRLASVDLTRMFFSYTAGRSSRAAWQGDQLVVVTHSLMRNNNPKHVPTGFDSEQTVRLSLSFDDTGLLIAEQIIIADPDLDSPIRIEFPSVVKAVYKKAS